MDTRTRGLRMKITPTGPAPITPLAPAAPAAAPAAPAASEAADATSADGALLRAARAQLQQMPEIDAARVAELRSALDRGEVRMDTARLADLIARYHGSKG